MIALALILATVTGNPPPTSYVCNGTTTSYTIPFPYLAQTDLVVTAGATTLARGTDYTVTPTTAPSTGTVKLVAGSRCANGVTLTITRSMTLTQPQPFRTGSYRGQDHEQAFDRLEMQVQQGAAIHTTDKAAQVAKDLSQDSAIIGVSNSVAALNSSSQAVTSTSSVLAFGSTTPRTLTARFSDVVNVKDYGATGDGSTDDTTAIQAAITAGGGKTITFPGPGVSYKVTNQINVATVGTRIVGNGSTIFMAFGSAATPTILFNVTASNVYFDGLTIDSTGTAATTSGNKYAIRLQGSSGTHLSDIRIRNCRFTNLPWNFYSLSAPLAGHAIYAVFVDGFWAQNNRIDNVGGAGVFMSAVTAAKVLDNDINNTGWYSIQLNDLVDGALIQGNRITGNLAQGRVWGGSINLMSNSSTGTACGAVGCARIKNVEIANNYISGAHSYTAAVHIESSSYVNFHDNELRDITLTYPSDFYANGTPPDYVRVYVRPNTGATNEGPNDHIDISNNLMIANGVSNIAVYVDAQDNGSGTLAYSDTLTVRGNRIISTDAGNYFAKGIILHGQQGGWRNVAITANAITGFPDSSSPVSGLLGVTGLVAAPVTDVQILGNQLSVVGGTPSTSTHLGISVDAFAQRVQVSLNNIRGFWTGLRTFANASSIWFGPGNVISGSGSSNILMGVGAFPANVVGGTSPMFVTPVLSSGRSSNLAASTLVSIADAGEYRVCATARTTTSGTGTTATINIIWTDEGGAKTHALASWVLNAVDATGQANGCDVVHAAAGTNIQVSTTGTYGTSVYAISATAEKLN